MTQGTIDLSDPQMLKVYLREGWVVCWGESALVRNSWDTTAAYFIPPNHPNKEKK